MSVWVSFFCEESEVEVSTSRTLSMFMGETTLFLCTVLTSQSLGAGHKTLKREGPSHWLNRKVLTGREREAKRMSPVFSGDRAESAQGKGLSQLFPAQCWRWWLGGGLKSSHSLPSSTLWSTTSILFLCTFLHSLCFCWPRQHHFPHSSENPQIIDDAVQLPIKMTQLPLTKIFGT